VLHRLEIANFYSIRDPQLIDLRAASNAPDEPGRLAPIWPGASERAPKVVALFGANASGKSNVLKALSFLAWFAKDSFQLKPSGPEAFCLIYGLTT
jgi:AAA15 family ATPase/GTPase